MNSKSKEKLVFGKERDDAEYRKSVGAIIYHRKKDKILSLDWGIYSVLALVQGGQYKGETEEETLRREITEETGYLNFEIKEKLGENIISYFYADNKKVWRKLELACYIVEILDNERVDQQLDSNESFKIRWVNLDYFINLIEKHQITDSENFLGLKVFAERAKKILHKP